MSGERSRDAAWGVIDQIWHERREASDSAVVRSISSERFRTLFDLFWQNQFEDDRSTVQAQVSEWVDLLISDGASGDEA